MAPPLPDKRRPAANCHLQTGHHYSPDGLPSTATAALHDESIHTAPIDRESRRPESTPGFFPNLHCWPLEPREAQNIASNRPSRAYKTNSRRPCLTPKPHRPSSLPPEPRTAAARAVSVADRPPPSISLHSLSPTKVRSGMSCPRPPLCFATPPGRPHGLGRRRPFPLHRSASLSTPSSVRFRGGRRPSSP
jgi:hypothetical protein